MSCDEPTGYAVKRGGKISIRTASYRPEAAMINGLVLFGGLPVFATGRLSDDDIRTRWKAFVLADEGEPEIVKCICIEAE